MSQTHYATRISNRQVSATLLGLVVEEISYSEKLIHYASIIGPQASLKSIWATLVSRKPQIGVAYEPVWEGERYLGDAFESFYSAKGAKGMKSFWTPLPGTAWHHMIAVSQDALAGDIVLVTNPEGVRHPVGDGRKKLLAEAEGELLRRFVATLNAATQIPVLPEWGKAVFTHAHGLGYDSWVKRLAAFGDALVAYRVESDDLGVHRAVLKAVLKKDITGKEAAQ